MYKANLTLLILAFTAACGDKDKDDVAPDTSSNSDPQGTDSDSGEVSRSCPMPEADITLALGWSSNTSYGGYVMNTTPGGVTFADVINGILYRYDFDYGDGYVGVGYDAYFQGLPYSVDKMVESPGEGYVMIADAAYTGDVSQSGRALILDESTYDSIISGNTFDILTAASRATVEGEVPNGYTGIGLVYDLTSDGGLDVVVSSATLPGSDTLASLAVFDAFNTLTGKKTFSDATFNVPVCGYSNVDLYTPTDMAVFGFGSGDGYLAVNCPGADYAYGEVWVFDLPLEPDSKPSWILLDVGAWYIDSPGFGYPLYIDDRGDDNVAVFTDPGDGSAPQNTPIFKKDTEVIFGASPAVFQRGRCSYLLVGDQGYSDKGVTTGAVYVTLLTEDGTAQEGDWLSLDLIYGGEKSPDLLYMGAVNRWEVDEYGDVRAASSGFQFVGKGYGGGTRSHLMTWTD